MEKSPQYTADSFIPIKESSKNHRNSSLKTDRLCLKRDQELSIGTPKSSDGRQSFKIDEALSLGTPYSCLWKKKADYTCGVVGLHEEINEFYEMMRPTDEERELRLKVVEHITKVVHSLWPQAQIEIFGSFRTGLFLPSSDIDMVIVGDWKSLPLSTLSEALQRNGIANSDITIIPHASVPILKVIHTPSKIRVDISFNATNGGKSAKFIKKLIKEYPPLPKLVLVLKQFLIHRNLNEVYSGGMNSYCLTLLVLSFLQGYHKPKTVPSTNLGTLLIEFFEHYGVNFNYERVSIHFDNGGNYQPKYRDAGSYLTVEDPLMAGRDVAKGTFLMHLLKESFQNAFHVLNKTVIESISKKTPVFSYLELILKVDEEILNNRLWLHDNHSSILRSISRLLKETNVSNALTIPRNEKKRKKNDCYASIR